MATTAKRRHDRSRLLAKRIIEERRYACDSDPRIELRARKRVTTGAMCSCSCCGSPRSHYGNSAKSKTKQELLADLRRYDD